MKLMEAWLLHEFIKDTDREDEGNEGGGWILVIIGVVIGAAILLDNLGVAPGQTVAVLKALVYPSTWDVYSNSEISYFNRTALLVFTAIGTTIGGIILMGLFRTIAEMNPRKYILPVTIVFFIIMLLSKITEKLILVVLVINIATLSLRIIYYAFLTFFSLIF